MELIEPGTLSQNERLKANLKQRLTSSSRSLQDLQAPPTPVVSELPQPKGTWQEERRLLMEMLEKSQRIAQNTQSASQHEQSEVDDQHKRIADRLKGQVGQLKKENTMLRSEMDRLRKCSGCTGDLALRSKLLQEIERLEAKAAAKEARLKTQIKDLTQKINGEQHMISDAQRKHDDEIEFMKTQIEKLRREGAVIGDKCKREENDLKIKLERLQFQLTQSDSDNDRLRHEAEEREKLIIKLRGSGDDVWSTEKQDLLDQNAKFVKLLEDKERLIDAQLRVIQCDKDQALKAAGERLDQLAAETQLLQGKLQSAVRLAGERESALQKEVDRLRRTNFIIMETTQTREEVQQHDSKGMRGQLETLQKAFSERERTYTQEVQSYRDELEKLHKAHCLLTTGKTPTAPDVIEKLRHEIGVLEAQLADKSDQLENLKEMYLSAKTSERAQVTKAIKSSQRTIEEFKKQQGALQGAYTHLQEALRSTELGDLESHRTMLAELKDLIEENARLNLKLKETDRLEYENEAQRKELLLLKQKLESVQGDLTTCEAALNEVEGIVADNVRDDRTFTQTELLHKTILENQRLTAANLCLATTRNQLEDFYLTEVKTLRCELQNRTRAIDELKIQNARLRSFRTKKSQEELSGWQVRQDALEKTIRALQIETGVLKANVNVQSQMAAVTRSLEAEELRMLRKEVLDKEAWVGEVKQSWEEEKLKMRAEVTRLRDTLVEIETSRNTSEQAVKDELIALEKLKDSLKKIEDDRLRRIGNDRDILESFPIRGDSKANPAAVTAAREEVEALKSQFANEKLSWVGELEEVKLLSTTELASARQVESILNRHISAQQNQIKTMTHTLEEVRALHAQEIKSLRQELATLRKSSGNHTQLLKSERMTLEAEIERVATLTGSKRDATLTSTVLEKVMKIQLDLAIVKGAYEKSLRLDPSNADDVQKIETDLAQLKAIIEKGDQQRREEKLEIGEAVATIKDSAQAVQTKALTERDLLVREAEVLTKRLKTIQNDADLVRKQRDEALESLIKMKSLGRLERSEVLELVESLKTQERTRILQLQEECMRLITQTPRQQAPRPQVVKKK